MNLSLDFNDINTADNYLKNRSSDKNMYFMGIYFLSFYCVSLLIKIN